MRIISKLRKRGLAMFMALVMCLSLLPTTAMAAEGTSNQTRIVPGVATPDAKQPNTYRFGGLTINNAEETPIGELDIWFATGVGDAVKDSINVSNGMVTVGDLTFTITVEDIKDSLAEKTKGKHLKIEGPGNATPAQQNEAWKTFLTKPENLTVTLTSDSFDYAVCFGSIPTDFAYNPVNGHYYTYVKTNGNIPWEEARDAAHAKGGPDGKADGGYLITITTEQEELFVERLFDGKFWTAGTRDPEVYPTQVTDAVRKLNMDTFGETVVSWATNGDTSPHPDTTRGNGAWFWGDGPADELGLIYYPFAVNPANSSGNSKVSYYGQYATVQWEDPRVAELVEKYSGKDYHGTYVNSDRELYYHWAQDGISLIEPNDNTGIRVGSEKEPPYVDGQLRHPENRELYMHVYGPDLDDNGEIAVHQDGKDEHLRWNDYASTDPKIEGYLVEFDGTTDMQATAYVSPVKGTKVTSNFKDTGDQVMIVPGDPGTITEDKIVSKKDGEDVPDGPDTDTATTVTKVKDKTNPTDPVEYKVVTTFTEGYDSYYSEKIVKVYDVFDYLALSLKCTTAKDDHGVKYYDLLGEDKENNLSSEIVVTATPVGESDGNFYFTITPRNIRTYDTDVKKNEADATRTHTFASANPSALVKMSYDAENGWSAFYKLPADAESWTDAGNKQAVNSVEKFIVPFDVECTAELHNVRKELVKSPEGLEDTLKSGVLFLADSSTYGDIKVENGTIKLAEGEEVKLLYKITVTGTKGAKYTVSDTGAIFLTDASGALGDGQNDGEKTTEGLFTDVLYAYRTYTRDQIEASKAATGTALINTVELKAGDKTEVKDPEDPKNPKKTDDEEVPAKKLFNVTVKYVDEDDKELKFIRKDDGTYASEQTVTGIENGTPYRTDAVEALIYSGLVDVNGNHYVKESETVTGNDGNNIKDGDVTITLVYTLDNWDEGNPDKPDPDPDNPNKPTPGPDDPEKDNPGDDIPDKYQVKVIYTTDGNGTVLNYANEDVPRYSEILNIGNKVEGYQTSGNVWIFGTTAKGNSGFNFQYWDAEDAADEAWAYTAYKIIKDLTEEFYPKASFPVQGGHIYTFTASFAQPGTYTLIYKTAPDGTELTDRRTTVTMGYSANIEDAYTQTGKEFMGWTTDPAGTPIYTPGNSITPTGDMTFYPVWKYTLSYNPNGGTGTMASSSQTTTADHAVFTVAGNGFTAPEGKKFIGWKAATGDKVFQPGEEINLTCDTTLYAQWTPVATPMELHAKYLIHYYLQTDRGTYEPTDLYDEVRTVTLNSLTDSVPVSVRFTDIKEISGYSYSFSETLRLGTMEGIVRVPTQDSDIVILELFYTKDIEPQDDDLLVTKERGQATVAEDGTATWTIKVKNQSKRVYENLSISDGPETVDNKLIGGLTVTQKDATQSTVALEDIGSGSYTDSTVTVENVKQRFNGWTPFGLERQEEQEDANASDPSGESVSQESVSDESTAPEGTVSDNLDPEEAPTVTTPSKETIPEENVPGTAIPEENTVVDPETLPAQSGVPVETGRASAVRLSFDGPEDDEISEPDWEQMRQYFIKMKINPSGFDLYPGEEVTFTVSYDVKTGDRILKNTVVVTDSEGGKHPGTSEEIRVNHESDLTVEKTRLTDERVNIGETIIWSIQITNNTGTSVEVSVKDTLSNAAGQAGLYMDQNGTEPVTENTVTVPAEGLTIYARYQTVAADAGAEIVNTVVVTDKNDPDNTDTDKSKETYVKRRFTVIYRDGVGGTAFVEQTYTVNEGDATPGFNGAPTRAGYSFTSWNPAVAATVTADAIYIAQWDPVIIPIPDIPFTPTPTPVTPTPTPTAPTPGTTIADEDVPLGGSVGLNDTDHFAYVIGYEDDTVRPLNNITRAEAATIFFRLMTDEFRQEHWATTNDFSDVKAGDWYNNAVSTCANAGVLKGYDDGTFRPNAPITRAEFASMAAGFMDESITDDGTGDFSDTANHWAAAAIRRAAKAGWVTGTGNKFNPDEKITRAEVMTIVNRMLDRTPDKDHMLPEMKKWIDNPESEWYYEAVQEATNEHDYERDELNVETWTELLTVRDWKALETEWANNGGASAPKADDAAVDQRRMPDGI